MRLRDIEAVAHTILETADVARVHVLKYVRVEPPAPRGFEGVWGLSDAAVLRGGRLSRGFPDAVTYVEIFRSRSLAVPNDVRCHPALVSTRAYRFRASIRVALNCEIERASSDRGALEMFPYLSF